MWFKILMLLMLSTGALAQRLYWGKKVYVGRGHARTYAEFTRNGLLKELGIALTHSALSGLGHTDKKYTLPLPQSTSLAPYQYVTLDWNPHGHEPDQIYTLPHFDMHFYFLPKSQIEAISCTNQDAAVCTKTVPPQYLVESYVPTPAGVPQMGWHWVDSLSGEFHGQKFTKTFIYGYYDGKPIFLEPMVTLAYLKNTRISVKKIRLPEQFPQAGSYPSIYQMSYNKRTRIHKIALRNFVNFQN